LSEDIKIKKLVKLSAVCILLDTVLASGHGC